MDTIKEKEEAKKQAEQERKEKEEMAIRTAKIMKDNGIDINTIAKATGLSKEEIEKL